MRIALLLLSIIVVLQAGPMCKMCIELTELLQGALIKVTPMFVVKDIVKSVCERQYESEQLCKKVASEMAPLAVQTGFRGVLKTGRLCYLFCPKGFYTKLNIHQEVHDILEGNDSPSFSYLEQLPYHSQKIKVNTGLTKFLHVTDVHLDLNYTVNSSIMCDYPICCHAQHGFPSSGPSQAPEYGHSKCDTPMKLFESGLEFMKGMADQIDAVVLTGDFSAHNEWEKTPQTVKQLRKVVETKIEEAVNVKMFSAPGNNQYLPDHQVDPQLYPEETLKMIELENQSGNTATFISINTLLCDTMNLYLIQDQTMPIRQLKTLNRILETKENVFLLAHISPTSASCSETYATLYRAILTRHSHKIKGQFYGHTHVDEFVVNTDPRDNSTATSYGLLAGSFSPLGTNQPRMRVYELTNDFDLLNYEDFAFSMKDLEWRTNYRFKEYYGLPLDQPITGQLMSKLQEQLKELPEMRKKYDSKASASPASSKFYCRTYDTDEKMKECSGPTADFRGKIKDMLGLVQGPWGSYGSNVQ